MRLRSIFRNPPNFIRQTLIETFYLYFLHTGLIWTLQFLIRFLQTRFVIFVKHRQSLTKLSFIWRTLTINHYVIKTLTSWKIVGNQTVSQQALGISYFKSLPSCWTRSRVQFWFLVSGYLDSLTPKNWRMHYVILCLIFGGIDVGLFRLLKCFMKKCVV